MTAPSRDSEIRRRRARKDKIAKLRQRYRKANSSKEKDDIFEKVKGMSPSITRAQFEEPLQRNKE